MPKLEIWEGLVAFVAGGGFASLFRIKARNRLDDANSAVALANAYGKLIDQLERRITSLELRIAHLERENEELRDGQ